MYGIFGMPISVAVQIFLLKAMEKLDYIILYIILIGLDIGIILICVLFSGICFSRLFSKYDINKLKTE